MDLSTLYTAYAAVLFACACSLTITWRQNPAEMGPRSWAIASGLGTLALFIFGFAALDKTQLWINVFANLVAWLGVVYYARGTRQFTGLQPTPRWAVGAYGLAAITTIALTAVTPYGPGIRIITGSCIFALFSFDVMWAAIRRREMRSAPSYFIALVFGLFGITHVLRGALTTLEYDLPAYARPVDKAVILIGIVGWGAIATGFSMLNTQRLLTERARNLRRLEDGVDHLREQFLGIAAGDLSVRAQTVGTTEPMDVLGQLFNNTAAKVQRAFGEIDRQRSVLSATQESMLDGLLLVDSELCILAANPAVTRLLEWDAERLPGRALEDLLAAEDKSFATTLLSSIASGPIRERTTRFVSQDGTPLMLSVRISAHRDNTNAVRGAVLVVRDDRELKEAQAQLQMSDRLAAMGTVAAGVAHEINNPLAYVMANVEFALEELNEARDKQPEAFQDELIKALEAAHAGTQRVQQIVLDLKNFSRSEDDEPGKVDVNRLVESAAAMLQNEVRHHARLELVLSDVPRVVGNEAKLGQVFLNLIHNAAQAIPLGRAQDNIIRVSSRVDERGVVVEVSDTGSGIAPEYRKQIFDAFFTTKPVGVGTGLGLAICHRVVTGLGGRIELESEVGKGSVFRVVLPPAEANASSSIAPPAETPEQFEARRVLIIDDEIEVGHSAGRILGKVHQVEVVSSAQEALQHIEAGRAYDVILCDLMMPEMTGMQLFKKLETSHPEVAKRVVFMSGGAFSPDAEDFLRRMQHRTIAKPFHTPTLRRVVSSDLSGVDLRADDLN